MKVLFFDRSRSWCFFVQLNDEVTKMLNDWLRRNIVTATPANNRNVPVLHKFGEMPVTLRFQLLNVFKKIPLRLKPNYTLIKSNEWHIIIYSTGKAG